jgi:hypothetical protein
VEAFIIQYWPQLLAVFAVIVWAVRVEAAVKAVRDDLESLKEQRREDKVAAEISRREVHEALSEMRSDIKDILKAVGGRK